ncbi:hypothetical protein [Anaerocolumna sp. MB42-C2]|uniref:hypothetical protein n=1 Tax=Anaerocolumna sp. MB42-C2 TaxID=3070997 RepID=UPI0027E1D527|nr:hypothetical protein [Anaerocolumna sp. MB42-C2]WMJ89341.1 hypothetical protein RBU59_07395 [Anaerocolumna sp. MB42-C2]
MVKNPVQLGAQASHKYDDIINLEYPLKSSDGIKHPRMQVEDRAKIFAPFAALKGYEEAIAAKQKIVVPRIELSEEAKEYLDLQLGKIELLLTKGQHPVITVVYFKKDKARNIDGGEYIQFTGLVAKFDLTSRILQIVEKKLRLDDIYGIEGEDLDGI